MSERAAASHFGISRASVQKMTRFAVPPGYQRTAEIKRPKLDGFTGFIDQWLQDDLNRPRPAFRKTRIPQDTVTGLGANLRRCELNCGFM